MFLLIRREKEKAGSGGATSGCEKNEDVRLELAAVNRVDAQQLLDAEQLVVFRGAVRAGQRTCLDLTAVGGNGKISNCGIFGFA